MNGITYVNGDFVPAEKAVVSIFDRGFLFADGVYEVCSVIRGNLIDNQAHLRRLSRSLDELDMPAPMDGAELEALQRELVARNALDEGMVYLQITRGPADRDFRFPENPTPSLVMFTQEKRILDNPEAAQGIKVVTLPDLRWKRRDIKTVGLLAASMAKQAAVTAGAHDAWLVEDGYVTEGSSSNAFIVTREGHIITRQLGHDILAGITREAVLALSKQQEIPIVERAFTAAEACRAKEAFVTSASAFVYPVVKIDETWIGGGRPGPVAQRLRDLYIEFAFESIADGERSKESGKSRD